MSIHPLKVAWKQEEHRRTTQSDKYFLFFFFFLSLWKGLSLSSQRDSSPLEAGTGTLFRRCHSWLWRWPSGLPVWLLGPPCSRSYCWPQSWGKAPLWWCWCSGRTSQQTNSLPWCWRWARKSDTPAAHWRWRELLRREHSPPPVQKREICLTFIKIHIINLFHLRQKWKVFVIQNLPQLC